MELFGDWIKPEWMLSIFADIRYFPQHTFIFLTKQPQNLIKWSPFPRNYWVGVTATDGDMFVKAMDCLLEVKAEIKFISFEPLLNWHIEAYILEGGLKAQQLDWLIIGAQTKPYKPPKIEWVQEIELAAAKAKIPIFEKDNLQPLLGRELIQEMPK